MQCAPCRRLPVLSMCRLICVKPKCWVMMHILHPVSFWMVARRPDFSMKTQNAKVLLMPSRAPTRHFSHACRATQRLQPDSPFIFKLSRKAYLSIQHGPCWPSEFVHITSAQLEYPASPILNRSNSLLHR